MGLLGKKIGCTQIFSENGENIPVTVVHAKDNIVTEIKTEENDGYEAVQMGYGKPKNLKKPQKGMFEKKGIEPKRYLKEFKDIDVNEYEIGDKVELEELEDIVNVRGKTKGKGFQGTIKRHNASRGRETHGSHFHRAPGSIGASADPAKVVKGMTMPGQMGHKYTTIERLKIVKRDEERGLLFIKGALPGAKESLLYIYNSPKKDT